MIEKTVQPITSSPNGVDLPEQFRRISAALWEAVERRDTEAAGELLDQRQQLLDSMLSAAALSPEVKRELKAFQASDKYMIWQLSGELEFLSRRLSGIGKRRAAFSGYGQSPSAKSHVQRTG